MCVNNLYKVAPWVALDSAAAGIEPAISSRKPNDPATTWPSHTTPTSNSSQYEDVMFITLRSRAVTSAPRDSR